MTSVSTGRSEDRPRRSGWVTAAAAITLADGGLGFLYFLMFLGGGLHPLLIVLLGVSALGLAAGVGLLALRDWARYAAGALACYSLFWYATTFVDELTRGIWTAWDWANLAANLFVLFVVLRRWTPGR